MLFLLCNAKGDSLQPSKPPYRNNNQVFAQDNSLLQCNCTGLPLQELRSTNMCHAGGCTFSGCCSLPFEGVWSAEPPTWSLCCGSSPIVYPEQQDWTQGVQLPAAHGIFSSLQHKTLCVRWPPPAQPTCLKGRMSVCGPQQQYPQQQESLPRNTGGPTEPA